MHELDLIIYCAIVAKRILIMIMLEKYLKSRKVPSEGPEQMPTEVYGKMKSALDHTLFTKHHLLYS